MTSANDEEELTPASSEQTENGSEQADHLYAEGMAYYQRRQWRQALAAFARLQEIQPQRQGVAALIDEINWFIQLEEMAPERRQQTPATGGQANRLRWLPWLLSLFILVAATIVVIIVAGDRLFSFPGRGSDQALVELYNEGQSQLAIGNYEGAIDAFARILAIDPDDIGAQAGLNQATLLRDLQRKYLLIQEAIASEQWSIALRNLDEISAAYPGYEDSDELRDYVEHQQALALLLETATAAYNASKWAEAIQTFEDIRERDELYRADAIREFLFVSYLEEGEQLISENGDDPASIRQAIRYFNAALTIHPDNQRAGEDRRYATLYEMGQRAAEREDWAAVVTNMETVYETRPDYAGGLVRCVLYGAYVSLAASESKAGNYYTALDYTERALAIDPPCGDQQEAMTIQQAILLALATATPTSTATSTPTSTPLPTATSTPTPTRTPLPPTPTFTPTPLPPTPTPVPPTPTKPPPPTPTPAPPTPTPTPYR